MSQNNPESEEEAEYWACAEQAHDEEMIANLSEQKAMEAHEE